MRCAVLVVFRQQLPHQILQRKKAKESKTVYVPEQKEWECVCHSALSIPLESWGSLHIAIITSYCPRSRLKDKSIWICLSSYEDSALNKRCSSPPNSTPQAKTPLSLSLLSLWLLVEGLPEMPLHRLQYHTFYCWVSKEHPGGNGASYESVLQ